MNKNKAEDNRLKELQSYCILDTPSETDFDHIIKLIASICEVPIATVTLIDENREWFKSSIGLNERENDRKIAFCAKAIYSKEIFIVPDTLENPEFSTNPMVAGYPHLRFYAGVPLVTPRGYALGTLAVKDFKPRQLSTLQIDSLKTLAAQVMVQLETRRQSQMLKQLDEERTDINRKLTLQTEHLEKDREFLRALLESLSEGIVACDDKGVLSLFNHTTRELHGLRQQRLHPDEWAEHYDLYLADGKTPMLAEQVPLHRAYLGEKITHEELVIAPKKLPPKIVVCSGQPILSASGKKLGAVMAMRDITEQKAKEVALAKSEAKLSAIFNQSYLFQGLMEMDGTVIDVNDIALEACGYQRHEEVGKKFWNAGWWSQDSKIVDYVKQVIDKGKAGDVVHASTDYHTATGERRQTEFVLTPIRDQIGELAYLLASGQDVTERKQSEAELASLNRALRLLSSSNELLIRTKDEVQLLEELCKLIVQVGGYEMAWVGYSQHNAEKTITPIAHYGDFSHLKNIKLSWADDVAIGKGPAARTIRSGKPVIVNDILQDEGFAPWAESAIVNEFRSVICLPLMHDDKVFGLVVMYAKQLIQVVDSEINLLQDLADDLAFGIMNIRAQEERQRFNTALYKMAASVSASIDKDFFPQLTQNMIEATGADFGFVAKFSADKLSSLETIAVVINAVESENFTFTIDLEKNNQIINAESFILPAAELAFLKDLNALTPLSIETCIGNRLVDANGKVIGIVAVMFKTTHPNTEFISSLLKIFSARAGGELDRLSSDRHIREQASLLDKAQDAIMVRGLDNRVQFWNSGAERLYGWTRAEAIGQSIERLLYPNDATHFYQAMEKLLQEGEWSGEIEQYSKQSARLMIESHWTLVYDEEGQPQSVFTINTNITERKAATDKIQYLAFYDPLTSLPNRTLLLDRLKKALVTCEHKRHYGALIFIDLDNFKALNDTLGHEKGDLLLIEIGVRLKLCVRESDSVARLGGDEFVVMLEDISVNDIDAAMFAKKVAEKILGLLNKPYLLGEYEHRSTASIGITMFSNQDNTVSELLKRADLAMYQAKAAGRNTFRFFDPKMQAEISYRVLLEADLRQALNKQQFSLHYQPQFNDKGLAIGAEALLRWKHPERGMVSPAVFIPVAEETRMILPIGHWVLETACAKLAIWASQPEMAHLILAVNVSVRQFRQPDFVEQVFSVLDTYGANPSKLKLELTESLFVENVEDIINKMHQLKTKGISFSLDDFGTGYSSLAYLKLMPINQLKIDQTFVRDILDDPNDASIAKTIIALAQSLGLEVIAEGVETQAQRDFLFNNQCHLYQGYFFSRPLPSEDFDAFIHKNNH